METCKALREVTVWEGDSQPNHDYAFNSKGQMVAYRKLGEGEWLVLKSPSKQFNKARRKFISIDTVKLNL